MVAAAEPALDLAIGRGQLASVGSGERVAPTRTPIPIEAGATPLDAAGRADDLVNAKAALAGLTFDGMSVMAGGFGLCGIPENLIMALKDSGAKNLTVIGNNVGCDNHGMWHVLANNQIRKVLASYVGENKILESRYMSGEIEIELCVR